MRDKVYLGDAVYAELTRDMEVVLTTEDGVRETNRIVMEAEVVDLLTLFLRRRGMISDGEVS